jgi:arylsulfatase A-like enzyme
MKRSRTLLICLLGAIASDAAGVSVAQRPNVLLISIDTLGARHMGSYGSARKTTPHLDRLASRSDRYAHVVAPSSWTLPGHVAMLSGRHPFELGIEGLRDAIPASTRMLAQDFADAGYQTAAFVDSVPGGFLGGERGFQRGFAEYHHSPHVDAVGKRFEVSETVDAGLRWLADREPDRPFFLFLHTKSVHTAPRTADYDDPRFFPYLKPAPYQFRFVESDDAHFVWSDGRERRGVLYLLDLNDRFFAGDRDPTEFPEKRRAVLEALYEAGVYYVDEHLGRLIAELDQRGLGDDTIIVVTSDHGEAFLEHHLLLHVELFEEVLHVPLLIHAPGQTGGRVISESVSLHQLPSMLLDLAGLAAARSPLTEPITHDDTGVIGSGAHFSQVRAKNGYESFALIEGRWKLVFHNFGSDESMRPFLYDLQTDPGEEQPIVDQPERLDALSNRLLRWRKERRGSGAPAQPLDAETEHQLRDLGYLR